MKKRRELFARLGLGFFGTIIILMGLSSIYSGNLNYSNYWGGVVFAPIAIIIGILVLIVVIFRWKTFDPMSKDENSNNQKTNRHDNWRKW
jgi:tellurite resistance protein TehA-like permease